MIRIQALYYLQEKQFDKVVEKTQVMRDIANQEEDKDKLAENLQIIDQIEEALGKSKISDNVDIQSRNKRWYINACKQ